MRLRKAWRSRAVWLRFAKDRPVQIVVSMLLLAGLVATASGPFQTVRSTSNGCGYGYSPTSGYGYGYGTCPPPPPPPPPAPVNGYWLVASDGGIFSFHAPFYGSMGAKPLNKPIVGMAADPVTGGYWLVASDGGIFSFHAPFYGSGPGFATQFGDVRFATPVIGMGAQAAGKGYWIVSAGGGVLPLQVPFLGSAAGIPLNRPVVAVAVRA